MPTPSSQGSTVTFNGSPIGSLTSFRVLPATAVFEDVTNVGSDVVGTSWNARVLREIACVAIEPGGVDINLYGCPPFIAEDVGLSATLEVVMETGTIANYAFLERFEVTGSVGQFLTGTATFRFAGQADED